MSSVSTCHSKRTVERSETLSLTVLGTTSGNSGIDYHNKTTAPRTLGPYMDKRLPFNDTVPATSGLLDLQHNLVQRSSDFKPAPLGAATSDHGQSAIGFSRHLTGCLVVRTPSCHNDVLEARSLENC